MSPDTEDGRRGGSVSVGFGGLGHVPPSLRTTRRVRAVALIVFGFSRLSVLAYIVAPFNN